MKKPYEKPDYKETDLSTTVFDLIEENKRMLAAIQKECGICQKRNSSPLPCEKIPPFTYDCLFKPWKVNNHD